MRTMMSVVDILLTNVAIVDSPNKLLEHGQDHSKHVVLIDYMETIPIE